MASITLPAESAVVNIVARVAACAGRRRGEFAGHGPGVAGKALQALVGTVENEFGALVVIKIPTLPVGRVVAGLAARSEFAFVHVILVVAPDTVRSGVLELGCLVALLAFDLDVFAKERETRQAVVELADFPAFLVVAAVTLLAFLAFVLVVLLVAGKTDGRQFLFIQVAGMAAVALGPGVLATQRVLGFAIVIEGDRLPVACGVAAVAFLAEVSFVFVILFVTTNTSCLQLFLIEDALVTRLAFGCPVFTC